MPCQPTDSPQRLGTRRHPVCFPTYHFPYHTVGNGRLLSSQMSHVFHYRVAVDSSPLTQVTHVSRFSSVLSDNTAQYLYSGCASVGRRWCGPPCYPGFWDTYYGERPSPPRNSALSRPSIPSRLQLNNPNNNNCCPWYQPSTMAPQIGGRKITPYNVFILMFVGLGSMTYGYTASIIGTTLGIWPSPHTSASDVN